MFGRTDLWVGDIVGCDVGSELGLSVGDTFGSFVGGVLGASVDDNDGLPPATLDYRVGPPARPAGAGAVSGCERLLGFVE